MGLFSGRRRRRALAPAPLVDPESVERWVEAFTAEYEVLADFYRQDPASRAR